MKKKFTFKDLWAVLKQSFSGFSDDKAVKLSASLAYYTVFSLGPLLIVIIFLCSIFFAKDAVEGSIYGQIKGFVGPDAAVQLQAMIKSASLSSKGTLSAVIGIATLLIGATSVFAEIQDSINMIWGLKPNPKKGGVLVMIRNRLLSFGMIGSLGFLLLVSLGVTALIDAIGDRLKTVFPGVTVILFYIIDLVLTLGITTAIFAVIFKVLPDAKIKWKDVWAGAIATSILFMIGKVGISFYISKSNIGGTYGAAGSFVILLLWIYYSSFILYFGAEFTKAWAIQYGSPIHPTDYAVVTKKVEVEEDQSSVQQLHEKAKSIENKSATEAMTQLHQEKSVRRQQEKTPPRAPEKKTGTAPIGHKPQSTAPKALEIAGGILLVLITRLFHSSKSGSKSSG